MFADFPQPTSRGVFLGTPYEVVELDAGARIGIELDQLQLVERGKQGDFGMSTEVTGEGGKRSHFTYWK